MCVPTPSSAEARRHAAPRRHQAASLRAATLWLSVALGGFACDADPIPASAPPPGQRLGPCYGNDTCNDGLECRSGTCVSATSGLDAGVHDDATSSGSDATTSADGSTTDAGPASDAGEASSDAGATADAASTVHADAGVPVDVPTGCFSGGPTVRQITSRAAAIDDDGVAHLAMGGDALRYATTTGGSWSVAVVDPHGDAPSLALDAAGHPVIAYFDRFERHRPLAPDVHALKVARFDGTRWTITTLHPELPRGLGMLDGPELAIAGDRIFVLYSLPDAPGDAQLFFATYDGAAWSDEIIETGTDYVAAAFLAVDVLGSPMIAFSRYTTVYLIRNVNAQWRMPDVIVDESRPPVFTFFADAAGRPAFLIGDRLIRETGTGWDNQACGQLSLRGASPHALEDGTPAFGAFVYNSNLRDYQSTVLSIGGTCELETAHSDTVDLDFRPTWRDGRDARVDQVAFAAAAGHRVLVYVDPEAGSVVVDRYEPMVGWQHETIIDTSVRGYGAAVAVTSAGLPVVASGEIFSGKLQLSRFDGMSWTVEDVPMGADGCRLAWPTSGGVDVLEHGTGDILVAFGRECPTTGAALVLARLAPFGWTSMVVEDGSTRWRRGRIRLSLSPDGHPVIVDMTTLWEFDGTQWRADTISTMRAHDSSVRSAVAYNELGRAIVATVERSDVAVGTRDAAGDWAIERVQDVYYGEGMTSAVAVDGAGHVHLAYTRTVRQAPLELRYAKREGASWTFETVTELTSTTVPGGPAGLDMILDGDAPVIAYYSPVTGSAQLATRDANGWTSVDLGTTPGDAGWNVSIAIDGNRNVHAAYRHRAMADLCYAVQPRP